MSEKCPRDKCDWQSGYDGKCRWPTDNCPWNAEREEAAKRIVETKLQEAAKRTSIRGVRKLKSGKWEAYITGGGINSHKLGKFDTQEEAEAIRKAAEGHRERGDLKEWIEKLFCSPDNR